MKHIPLSTPNLSLDILDNLKECIETGWVSTGGRFIKEFEEKVAQYVGVDEAVSMQSGTAGLHTALRVLDIGQDDEVIVPTLTFIAAVNPVKYVGAQPVFMDCDDSLCMDADKLQQFLEEECELIENGELKIDNEGRNINEYENFNNNSQLSTVNYQLTNPEPRTIDSGFQTALTLINKKTKRKVSAIIVVHVFGNLANMEKIINLAKKYNLKVIEDATEALGSYYTDGKYKGKHGGTIGDIGVYSFNANKIITTGGGGMIVSNDKKLLDRARYLGVQAKNDSLFFVHDEIGYNYRMLNIQAALGVDQIDRLESIIETKIKNYNLYKELLSDIKGFKLLRFGKRVRANHWFYSLLVDKNEFEFCRDDLLIKLNNINIQTRPLWRLIHKQRPYERCQTYKIEKAIYYEERILNIPCSSNLGMDEVKYVCNVIKNNI